MIAMPGSRRYGAVLQLPKQGRLIATTDLHGNLGDFVRLEKYFEESLELTNSDSYMLVCGDLVHGPIYNRKNWPRRLGTYYPDESVKIVERFIELRKKYPGRVFALLGNHEHSHLGGPRTRKFHKIPSETEFFEQSAGEDKTEIFRALFSTFPILCVAGRGMVFTHGAPRMLYGEFEDVAAVNFYQSRGKKINEMFAVPVLGELLWWREVGALAIRRFLKKVEIDGQRNGVALYGHDPVSLGYQIRTAEQICFSTSFGLKNKNKVYVDVDLSREIRSAYDMRLGLELKHLYPEEAEPSSPLLLNAQVVTT